jgi:hypothetical protein
MQAYRERTIFLFLLTRNGHPSGRQKVRNKREQSEADVNGSGGAIPRRDIVLQIAEPLSLRAQADSVMKNPRTDRYLVLQARKKKRTR